MVIKDLFSLVDISYFSIPVFLFKVFIFHIPNYKFIHKNITCNFCMTLPESSLEIISLLNNMNTGIIIFIKFFMGYMMHFLFLLFM